MCYFKCDVCGKFISFFDLDTGKAIHRMITPDSDISIESFETLCPEHNQALHVDKKRRCHACKVEVGEVHKPFCSVGNDTFLPVS